MESVAAKLDKSTDRDVRIQLRVLSLLFGDQKPIPVLRNVAADPKVEPAERRSARRDSFKSRIRPCRGCWNR